MTMPYETMPPQTLIFFVLFFLPFVALLHVAVKQSVKRSKRKQQQLQADGLPPSPPGLPFIGHLHLIGFLPHISLRDLAGRYGQDGLMLVRLGSVPTIIVSSRRATEAVMRTHDHLLASRPPSTVAHTLLYGSRDVIFAAYGDHWRRAKKILTLHLLTLKKVQSYCIVREDEARVALAKVSNAAEMGQTMDMSELLYSFTFEVMCRAVSGRSVKLNGTSRLFRELLDVTEMLIGGFNAEDYFPWLLRVGPYRRAVCARAQKVRKRWDELLDRVMDDHEGKLVQQQVPNFIEVLLSHQHEYGFTRDHLKALLVDIFVAGTDTSYIVLEFAMVELMRNPHNVPRR
ncbi:hypothetical protein QOZ80_2AG0110080 [Eleusine coracana subsp. coracana]|nr:hypothetical protein QOZ80_2AG0110080 [Eleusine coracana subsp. coracana]